MPKFACTLPVVGIAYVEVEAETKEEAVELALMSEWQDLEIMEECVVDKVCQGNVNYHPCTKAYAQKIED